MFDISTAVGTLIDKEGLLTEIYRDLAAPGVRQVGKALDTIIETGCLALLPLRLANAKARDWEERTFAQIAQKLQDTAIDNVEPIRPEIGVPVLDALSKTADPDLREMFLNLLASAATKQDSKNCHPSFSHVISQLSPDEAKLIRAWSDKAEIPTLTIGKNTSSGVLIWHRHVLELPDQLDLPEHVPVYIANLIGLGIVNVTTDSWLSDDEKYASIIKGAREKYPDILLSMTQGYVLFSNEQRPDEYMYYEKGILRIEPYGRLFQKACLNIE